MTTQQRVVRIRRSYNQWVANQTLEDYALRFTARSGRKWSHFRVANTAIGAISFLALEAIGGAITVKYGFANAVAAILSVGVLIFLTGLPIAYYAATYGMDIDLLTRGAGFGYFGSTVTSVIYASFTFIFFALEAAIMALALEMWLGLPLAIGYVISSLVILPLVTHGITLISRVQLWTQPFWIILQLLPFAFIAMADGAAFEAWTRFGGLSNADGGTLNIFLFGTAATVVFSLIAQIGEQVDFLRFLPPPRKTSRLRWWAASILAGPGWIFPGMLKMLAGSFLAFLAVKHLVPPEKAVEPTQMYLVAFQYVFSSPPLSLAFTGAFVILSQIKINVTNAYAGSIAWSNFFSRLTHRHPGRVVWLVFNVAIALMLMELGIFQALEHILGLYSMVAVAWVGALVADLTINKPLGLSPPGIEFKRAHLYDINPVGIGSMLIATLVGMGAYGGLLGEVLQALTAFITLAVSFAAAPVIALFTRGKYYIARMPWQNGGAREQSTIPCVICEHHFEAEDMAHCPAYAGPICSLCCSLDTNCRDLCRPSARLSQQALAVARKIVPAWAIPSLTSTMAQFIGVFSLCTGIIAAVLLFVYFQVSFDALVDTEVLKSTLWTIFFILTIIAGIAAWLFVLAHENRRAAEEESRRQTELLLREIEAHKRTDAKLQKAKEIAEAASKAKSRYIVGLSHELRTPLNAILGYAQILERDPELPMRRRDAVRVVRRSAEHLSGLIDSLLDISKIEAGRFHLNRNEVCLPEFIKQLVDMFHLQAAAKGIAFRFVARSRLPLVVQTDENRLRQILINLLSNAIKFTDSGHVTFRAHYRSQVAEFEIEDTGIGIDPEDLKRIFQPFERARSAQARNKSGTGLGLTITKLLTAAMGGQLTVTSEVNKGTTFRVKLLLSEVLRPRTTPTMENAVRGYTGERQTILVVDDNETQRQLVRDLLEPLGFVVLTAANGSECLALAARHKPSLVLLDVLMPDMDGWEVARRLRQSTAKRPAIVMLSANTIDKDDTVKPPRVYDGYLMKPVDLRQLLETIHTLLNIDWIYEGDRCASRAYAPCPPSATLTPPVQDVDEIIHLAQIGYIRGIHEKLDAIEARTAAYREFAEHVRQIAHEFDMKRLISVLESVRHSHG